MSLSPVFPAVRTTVWSCRTLSGTRKLPTCVGIIVSRMFLIVSMVSWGEAVLRSVLLLLLLLLLLRPGLAVLDWPRVSCGSVSLPNVTRAFSKKTWCIELIDWKKKNPLSLCFHQVPLGSLSNHSGCLSFWAFAGPELVRIWSAEARKREKHKILSILLEYPNCTCLSTSTSLTHRPFALAKTTLRPLSVSFLGRGPEERLAKDSPRCTDTHTHTHTHTAKILMVCVQVQWFTRQGQ